MTTTTRDACAACNSDDLQEFLDLGDSPIADAYTATSGEKPPEYPLRLVVCGHCFLVQLSDSLDSKTLFGTGYSFYSSSSAPLSVYHQAYATQVADLTQNRNFVVEIGCNDGDMLRWFDDGQRKTLGIDPASGPVEAARDRGLDVIEDEFTAELAAEIREDYGRADVVIANHVLAHVGNVNDFLTGVELLLADEGTAFVEVQYLGDLLVNNAFDLVYHEHQNFFSLTSLNRAVKDTGMRITNVEFTRRQQGSIRVQLKRAKTLPSVSPRVPDYYESEWWLRDLATYHGVEGRVERIRMRLWNLIDEAICRGRIAGYGAPAKATTLLNYCEIDRDVIDYVIDSTPAKQGRYIPGTGIPIISPSTDAKPPETYLLLSWNYLHEIIRREQERMYQLKVKQPDWIIPLPGPVLL